MVQSLLTLALVGGAIAAQAGDPPSSCPTEPGVTGGACVEERPPPPVPAAASVAEARRYINGRRGRTAFAVIDTKGRLTGLRTRDRFVSASVVKAMLLVGYLDSIEREGAKLTPRARDALDKMIRRSDNKAATAFYSAIGNNGLYRVAQRARMDRFFVVNTWASAQITAADQARFFLRIDRLTPAKHRAFVRKLLSTIVSSQSWGVPKASRPRYDTFFKGGWRRTALGRLVHQGALLEEDNRRLSIVVLTDGNPTMDYGENTIEGVTARLLKGD